MNRTKKYLSLSIFLALGLIFLAVAFRSMPTGNHVAGAISNGYPPPKAGFSPTADQRVTSYPAPIIATPSRGDPIPIPTPIFQITSELDPALATNIALKAAHTPSPTEIAERATELYYKMRIPTEPAGQQPTPYRKEINALNELPGFVYSDPFFAHNNQDNVSKCLQAKNPGEVTFILSLGETPGYYLLPFWSEGKVCGVALIHLDHGYASAGGWAEVDWDRFPIIDVEEVILQVRSKSAQEIVETPILVSGGYKELWQPFVPAWQVKTDDGEIYYVLAVHGPTEDGLQTTFINVYNSNELTKP